MIYKLNQTTQMGKVTDEMLEKLMQNQKSDVEKALDRDAYKRGKQIDYMGIEGTRNDQQEKQSYGHEYKQIEKRGHTLALNILNEEKKELKGQIAQYNAMIKAYQIGEEHTSDLEMKGLCKLYDHLQRQLKVLNERIMKYDKNMCRQHARDEEKERIIKMLAKKYSDTLQ